MKVHQIRLGGHLLEAAKHREGKPGRRQVEVLFNAHHLMIRHLNTGRRGLRAQGQHLAFDAKRAAALAQLEHHLLDPARGVRIVGFEEMKNAHEVPAGTAERP